MAGVRDDAAAIDLGLTSAIVDNIALPKFGTKAGSQITLDDLQPGGGHGEPASSPARRSAARPPPRR